MQETTLISTLEQVGLTPPEAQTYIAMLELGESGIIPIAKKAGIKRTTAYNYLETFLRLGLISVTVRNTRKHYVAASPTRLEAIMQERLRKVQAAVPTLLSFYKETPGKPSVQMYEGKEGVQAAFSLALESRDKELLAIPLRSSGHGILGDQFVAQFIAQTRKKGIGLKTIRVAGEDYSTYPLERIESGDNREIRVAPSWFQPESHVHIYDDVVATFSQINETPYAMVVTSRSHAQTMRMLHQGIWEQSIVPK
jgi:sugar-specific transcriptional regulator TrmB